MGRWLRWATTRLRSRTRRSAALDLTATIRVYRDGVLQGSVPVVLRAPAVQALSLAVADTATSSVGLVVIGFALPPLGIAVSEQVSLRAPRSVSAAERVSVVDRVSLGGRAVSLADGAQTTEWFVVGTPSRIVFSREVAVSDGTSTREVVVA